MKKPDAPARFHFSRINLRKVLRRHIAAGRVSHVRPMKMRPLVFFLFLTGALLLRAAESETLAERSLKQLVERQQTLFAAAAKAEEKNFDPERFRAQAQELNRSFDRLLQDNPKYAPGYAAYAYFLGKIDMRKESAAMFLKANQLDPNLPLVKNQLGNYLAEEGKPLEAVNYFLAAIKLAPNEPLYHYQLGTLLTAARDDFIKSGAWSRRSLEEATQSAFRRAAELAPDRVEFAYRYAESFYDLEKPDWETALKLWGALEEKASTDLERQTLRLHAANIFLKQGKPDHARALLDAVTEPALENQKQKLVAQLAETAKK
jgi:tetratricopeptide (TPR) repeat protein